MEKILPPSVESLSPNQAKVVSDLMIRFIKANFSREELMKPPIVEEILNLLVSAFQTEHDFSALMDFTKQMVNWYRPPALWFAYFLQLLSLRLKQPFWNHVEACLVFADAQMNFNQDLALDSTEVAYDTFLKSKAQLETTPLTEDQKRLLDQIEGVIRRKLKVFYNFFSYWSKPFDPMQSNPLTENLYYHRTRRLLLAAFPTLDFNNKEKIEANLLSVIEKCNTKELVYYRVIARRSLGHLYLNNKQKDASIEQLKLALQDAMTIDLEAEVSHLNRLLGYVLATKWPLASAMQEAADYLFRSYQIDAPFVASYWRSLSARELGFLLRMCPTYQIKLPLKSDDFKDPMKASLYFYMRGRVLFDAHLSDSSELPISSAVKLQMFRCYSENAIDQALAMKDPHAVLAEIESNSPREIVQMVSEMQAAQDLSLTAKSKADLQKTRAVLHKYLGTVPATFEEYLATFAEQYKARHAYIKRRLSLLEKTGLSQISDYTVDETLKIRLPSTYFLLFNVARRSMFALINMENGTVTMDRAFFSENQLQAIQQEYRKSMKESGDNITKLEQTIDFLIERYEELLSPVFEPLLSEIEGKHLKIFPRLQMNTVPLHALRIRDKRLIEYCDVSYNQSLSLYLQLHKENLENPIISTLVVYNECGTQGFLKGSINTIEREYTGKPTILLNSYWRDIKEATSNPQTKDIYFACHGRFNPKIPTLSYLRISKTRKVGFPKIFSSLDLGRYRSIVLGACESGIAKAELAAEYVGLPSAFLAAGVNYVIGSLWEVNELATAILFSKYFEFLATSQCSLPEALNEAQRQLMSMSNDEVVEWSVINIPHLAPAIIPEIKKRGTEPYNHPLYWAGFYISGDT